MENLDKILKTFINDSEFFIEKAKKDLYFIEKECDSVDKEIEKESIYYAIDIREDLVISAKRILKEIDK